MSVHLYIYAGPFFLVPKQNVLVETTERRCSNSACAAVPESRTAPFCSKCGAAVTSATKVGAVNKYPRPTDVAGDWVDYMSEATMPDGRVVWVPNRHDFGYVFSEDGPLPLMPIDSAFIADTLAEFLSAHRDIFDAFHAQFGSELIEGFGVVPYTS